MTLCIVACQAHLPMGFSRQEYWSRLPFPPPGDLPNPGIKPGSPADAFPLSHRGSPLNGIPVLSHSVVSNSLRPHGLQPARLLCPWDFPGKNIGAGCHFLLQGIFPTQGLNPGLLHCSYMHLGGFKRKMKAKAVVRTQSFYTF